VARISDTLYATTDDGVSIAYQIVGDGPVDLVLELESWGNVEIMWELDALADLFERLSQFSRLVLHDRRATGLSGGVSFPNLETRARDLLAVLDAIRSPRAVLFGERTTGAAFTIFAASHPNRCVARVEQGSRDEAVVARVPVGPDARRASRGSCGDAGRDGEHGARPCVAQGLLTKPRRRRTPRGSDCTA
jgi:pimeloyl-ACP methyl ester carboxylesterase